MSNISDAKLKEIISCVTLMGKEKTTEDFGLSMETLNRYLRRARSIGLLDDLDDIYAKKPNVLVLDIETSPIIVSSWRIHKVILNADNVIRDWHLLTYAVKWLFEPEIYSGRQTSKEAIKGDDSRIANDVWGFVEKADVIIAHNGVRFDIPKLNTRFFANNIMPPSPFVQIDTLKVFQSQMLNTSNKQGELCKKYGFSQKVEHEGIEMWHKCINGDEEALKKMEEYNKGDILGLEELYVAVRPWIKSHPNMSLFYNDVKSHSGECRCGSTDLVELGSFYTTSVNRYKSYRCNNCFSITRTTHSDLKKEDRIGMRISTAR